jgi:tetratricopeptide (TPR) repeat protein
MLPAPPRLRACPTSRTPPADLARGYLARAQVLIHQDRLDDAVRQLRGALAADPESAEAHALLGATLARQGAMPEALAEAREAVALAPDEDFTHYHLAWVLHRGGHDRRAASAIAEALRLEPADAPNLTLQAWIMAALGRWQASLAAAERALALEPESAEAARARAETCLEVCGGARRPVCGRRREGQRALQAPAGTVQPDREGWPWSSRETRPPLRG